MTTQHDERAELIRRLNFAADNNLMLPPAYAEAFRKAAALLAADGQAGGEVSGLTEEQIEQTLEAADELFQAGAFNDIRRHVRAVSDLRRWLRNLRYTHPQPQAVAQGKPPRIAFEHHWQKTRGGKKSRNELQRHPLQPQTYVNDSANRHWVTWQAAQAAMLSASPAAPAAAQVAQPLTEEQLLNCASNIADSILFDLQGRKNLLDDVDEQVLQEIVAEHTKIILNGLAAHGIGKDQG